MTKHFKKIDFSTFWDNSAHTVKSSFDFDTILRNLLTEKTNEKGYVALHADEIGVYLGKL